MSDSVIARYLDVSINEVLRLRLGSGSIKDLISLASQAEIIHALADQTIRGHWGLENRPHWVLDTTFRRDVMACTNSEFLVGRTLILKVANNWLTAFQKDKSSDTDKQSSKEFWKVRCLDAKGTMDRLVRLL